MTHGFDAGFNPDSKNNSRLWEVLIPVANEHGALYPKGHHQEWDQMVRAISGGLTIIPPVLGQWHDPDSKHLLIERMIPVRVLATDTQINQIIDLVISHYNQKVVFAYVISNQFILKEATYANNIT